MSDLAVGIKSVINREFWWHHRRNFKLSPEWVYFFYEAKILLSWIEYQCKSKMTNSCISVINFKNIYSLHEIKFIFFLQCEFSDENVCNFHQYVADELL